MTGRFARWLAALLLLAVAGPAIAQDSDLGAPAYGKATTALNAPGLRELRGPLNAVFGIDSLTNGNDDPNAGVVGGLSYSSQVAWLSKGRLVIRRKCGIPGNTSVDASKRLWDECLSIPGIDVFGVLECTNDLIQSIASSVCIRDDTTAIRATRARGVKPIILAIPPNTANGAGANALNALKKANAQALGAIWIDPWAAARASDGTYVTGASLDGVHPVEAYTTLAAQVILADPQIAPLLPTYGAASQLVSSELLNTIPTAAFDSTYTSGSNVIPIGWTAYATGTTGAWAVSVASDATSGSNLATIAAASGATGQYTLQSNNFDVSVYAGRRVNFCSRFKASGLAASGGTVTIRLSGSGDAAESNTLSLQFASFTVDGDGYLCAETQVPAGASTAAIYAYVSGVTGAPAGGLSLSFGEMSIRPSSFQGLDTRMQRQPGRIRNLTASATVSLDDSYILVDATAGAVTVTLPSPGINYYGYGSYASAYQKRTPGSGLEYTIVKTDSSANVVTVAVPSSVSILDGASTVTTESLSTQGARARLLAGKSTLFVRVGS